MATGGGFFICNLSINGKKIWKVQYNFTDTVAQAKSFDITVEALLNWLTWEGGGAVGEKERTIGLRFFSQTTFR